MIVNATITSVSRLALFAMQVREMVKGSDDVGYAAHVGGFLFGFVAMHYLK
jgi:membrane associated rhomboid family serine protease